MIFILNGKLTDLYVCFDLNKHKRINLPLMQDILFEWHQRTTS